MAYRCETTSVEGLVQLLASNYLPHGYWFYVTGSVPEGKDPRAVDAKLIAKYGIDLTRHARARQKRLGRASVVYLRHGRFFVLVATHGQHRLFEEEAASVRDIRRVALRFRGYSISYRRGGRTRAGQPEEKWHSHVEIERGRFKELEAWFRELAPHRSATELALEFYRLPFEPYAPIRRQMLRLLRAVNGVRRRAGYEPLPYQVLPLRRRIVKPFASRIVVSDSSAGTDGNDGRNHSRTDQVVRCSSGSHFGALRRSEIQGQSGIPYRKDGKGDGN